MSPRVRRGVLGGRALRGSRYSGYEGRTPEHKIFTAHNIKTGFWAGSITVAVVRYKKNVGYLNTAYLTTLDPKGRILWQRP